MNWPIVKLASVAEIDRASIQPEAIEGGTRYLGLEHIESGGRIIGGDPVENGDLASSKFKFSNRHVLYGKLRPYLAKIALPEFEGVCSTDILPIRPKSNLDRRYLAYFLRQPDIVSKANSLATGANLPRLSPKALEQIKIPLPPLEEQKRIAGILDQADALRRLRARALEKLNTLGQAVFQEMFGDGPESTYKLSEICELINGDRSSNYPSGEDIKESGILFLSTKNIQNWTLNYDKSQFITEDKFRSLSRGKLIRGDIVITLRGTLGQAAIFDGPYETGFINAQMMILRPFQQVTSEYLLDFLRHPSTQSELLKGQSGSAVKQLTAGRIGELSVQIPSPQRSISYRENTVQLQRIIVDAHDAKSKSDALFASLQSAAFQGKL